MALPKIKISVRDVERHGAGVLQLGPKEFYADIDDIAEAMHVPPEIIYGALASLQDLRKEQFAAKVVGENDG